MPTLKVLADWMRHTSLAPSNTIDVIAAVRANGKRAGDKRKGSFGWVLRALVNGQQQDWKVTYGGQSKPTPTVVLLYPERRAF